VVTWRTASSTAAVANDAFAAIVEEKSVVTRSVYVSLTSASGAPLEPTSTDETGQGDLRPVTKPFDGPSDNL
jgi:hypothetical protein